MVSAVAAEVSASAVLANTSTRTLILGIDKAGRIRQHDRGAGDVLAGGVLAGEPSALIGTELSSLLAVPDGAPATVLQSMIDGACSNREGTTVLSFRTANDAIADAVVTVQPIRSADPELAAQVIMRIAPPVQERFLDPAVMRQVMIDGAVRRAGGALDIDQMAPELMGTIVPHFCNAAELVVLESLVADDEFPSEPMDGMQIVRRLAVVHDDGNTAWDAAFPTGEILRYPPNTPYTRCMDTGRPVCELVSHESAEAMAGAWIRRPVAGLLSGVSMLLLPLIARDVMLGFIVCVRRTGYRRFDPYDVEIGMEFAARAAIFMDNAQRYSRERTTALTLQRSMLPTQTGLSAPSSVEVRHRYLPGSKLIEVGGDWYESIALPGGRVALVVGDVAGHGVRAAVTMGRLRTAIQTLAMLELPPAETLQQLNELMHELGSREPHFATCVYAIFDAVTGTCEVASAGHLPPLLVRPDGTNELLDVPQAPPLGVGSGLIQSRTLHIEDGSLLVLYTDGLVEKRSRDIDEGIGRLREIFGPGSANESLEELCKATLAGVYADEHRDDIAVLMARLRRLPADRIVTWALPSELTSASRARSVIRRPLRRWGLTDLLPTAELLVSELVTNAVRYAQGKIGLRLVLENGLVCEVLDDSAALPRLRHPDDSDERGRGLQVVSQLAQRWGARRAASGKVVWCELPVPAD
ncbi:MAG TPA: SpoIIE family protein phosphatase [Streptosporangiaceae bacterium]|nr:SpoIIE family protein phosphatase [Streptosporangiaceae bacterium]